MANSRFVVVALIASCCAWTSTARAVDCIYKAAITDTRIVKDSGEIFDPQDWLSDAQCERLRVVTGKVRVVTASADGSPERREITQGRLAPSSSDGGSSLFRAMLGMIAGDIRSRTGRSRGDASGFAAVDAALPRGKVVKPDGDLRIPLPIFVDEVGGAFVLSQSGKTVLQTRVTADGLAIPGRALEAGSTYRWQFRTGSDHSDGSFDVVDRKTYEAALEGSDDAGHEADFLAAAKRLQAAGYSIEARRLLRQWIDE